MLPNKTIDLGEKYGKLPLVTIGDSAFPRFPWLLKGLAQTLMIQKKNFISLS